MKAWIAAAALAVFATPALAEDQAQEGQARAVPVSYLDLDIEHADDAQALLSRLRYAATRACEVSAEVRPGPALRRRVEECRSAALDEAVAQADSAEVTRLHSEQRR
jgi:UrcA family protein